MDRGVWNNMLLGIIIALLLLGIIIYFWKGQSGVIMKFVKDLIGIANATAQ